MNNKITLKKKRKWEVKVTIIKSQVDFFTDKYIQKVSIYLSIFVFNEFPIYFYYLLSFNILYIYVLIFMHLYRLSIEPANNLII